LDTIFTKKQLDMIYKFYQYFVKSSLGYKELFLKDLLLQLLSF